MELTVTEQKPTRALLVEVDTGEYDAEASLAELFELAQSAGAEPVASVSQKLSHVDSATCVGSGKLEEIRDYCEAEDIDLIIFDLELSPVQIRNIEHETDVRVIDRARSAQIHDAPPDGQGRRDVASGRRYRHARTG